MSYVYIRTEPGLWTAGFYGADGQFEPESDHGSPNEASQRVAWLNGGGGPEPGTEDDTDADEASSEHYVEATELLKAAIHCGDDPAARAAWASIGQGYALLAIADAIRKQVSA